MFKLILLIATISSFLSFSEIQKAKKRLDLGDETLLDERIWYTPQNVHDFFKHISGGETQGREGLDLYVWMHTVPDVIFPIAYGTLLAAGIVYFNGAGVYYWKLAVPILAVFFDLGENFTTAYLARSYPKISSSIAWLACGYTLMKWTMIAFSAILIVMGIINSIRYVY